MRDLPKVLMVDASLEPMPDYKLIYLVWKWIYFLQGIKLLTWILYCNRYLKNAYLTKQQEFKNDTILSS